MAELRELFEESGCADVTTYIQSGNVAFTANASLASRLGEIIAQGIEERYGFRVPVMLRTAGEMANVVAGNPFVGRGEPTTLHVSSTPRPARTQWRRLTAFASRQTNSMSWVASYFFICPTARAR